MSLSILVIDDDAGTRATLKQILEEAGFSVLTAVDGRDGFALFRHRMPDLIITDVIMPEREGIEIII
jgi:CheY-like chemotaxis protein